jgi:hypothetical protein
MNTPHERLIRTTFSLPLGEVHALVGDAVNARARFSSSTVSPITRQRPSRSSRTSPRPIALSRPGCRGYAPSPIVGPYDLPQSQRCYPARLAGT